MRFAWLSLGLATLSACAATTQTVPQNTAQCRAQSAQYAGVSFPNAKAEDTYFSQLITGVNDADPTQRFVYLECLDRVNALPTGVSFENTSADIQTGVRPRNGSSVLIGGSGYRTGQSISIPQTPTLPARPSRTTGNGLALPTQYALQPGDTTLWASMSLTQQTSAISYLQSGSTIASSLVGGS